MALLLGGRDGRMLRGAEPKDVEEVEVKPPQWGGFVVVLLLLVLAVCIGFDLAASSRLLLHAENLVE